MICTISRVAILLIRWNSVIDSIAWENLAHFSALLTEISLRVATFLFNHKNEIISGFLDFFMVIHYTTKFTQKQGVKSIECLFFSIEYQQFNIEHLLGFKV